MLSRAQAMALVNPISTEEELKQILMKPTKMPCTFSDKKEWHVALMVSPSEDKRYCWIAIIRLLHLAKGRYKSINSWLNAERAEAMRNAGVMLQGVGKALEEEVNENERILTVLRPVNTMELSYILRPSLLGEAMNKNGYKAGPVDTGGAGDDAEAGDRSSASAEKA